MTDSSPGTAAPANTRHSRAHFELAGTTPRELGRARGLAMRGTIDAAYQGYAAIFRAVGVSEAAEREAAVASFAAVEAWRPEIAEELRAVADASGLSIDRVMALNARTEILAMGTAPAHECSTVSIRLGGAMHSVQTWDWHVDLAEFWHTQTVSGLGYRFAGITEQGILAKIGLNEAGLAVNFNILGHAADGPGGVPVHLLAYAVLRECATVEEAVALVRATPVSASTSLTLTDTGGAVSLEVTPVGVFEAPLREGYLIRTNHFQHPTPLREQKASYEPDSSERFDLLEQRIAADRPADLTALVSLLESGEGDPPLSCVADPAMPLGDRWQTLATVVMTPAERRIRVLDGMPTEAATGPWVEFTL
ncbi:C45 family autoproteolytic acyltransferase/hydrolase [Leucobacter sp. Z1108]|uniref:C45 family autoproteolytic acyltransferase/hydolase n=1 Tax=Leucobacter sp. Z1108 TaxID=3439066 RepID=UPI003F2E50A9